MPSVADLIRAGRKKLGISQRELASKLGVSRGLVGQWENETTGVTVQKLIQLCQFFHVDATQFFQPGGQYSVWIVQNPEEMLLVSLFRNRKPEERGLILEFLNKGVPVTIEGDKPQSPGEPDKPRVRRPNIGVRKLPPPKRLT